MSKKKVALLFDRSNDWIEKFLCDLSLSELNGFDIVITDRLLESFDIVFMLGCTSLLTPSEIQRHGMVLVIHESDLPKNRGFAPVQWQVLAGKNNITVSLIEAAQEADSGDIIMQKEFSLNGYELNDEIRKIQAETSLKLVEEFLLNSNSFIKVAQKGIGSYCRRRTPIDSELDVSKPLKEQFNLLRVVDNKRYPAFFVLDGHRYRLAVFRDDD